MKSVIEIQTAIHESRRRIGCHYTTLSEEIDITRRLRNSIRRQPWAWVGGALTAGMIAGFFRRSSTSYKKVPASSQKQSALIKHAGTISSLFLGETTLGLATGKFLRFLFPLLRPMITKYVMSKFSCPKKDQQVLDIRP